MPMAEFTFKMINSSTDEELYPHQVINVTDFLRNEDPEPKCQKSVRQSQDRVSESRLELFEAIVRLRPSGCTREEFWKHAQVLCFQAFSEQYEIYRSFYTHLSREEYQQESWKQAQSFIELQYQNYVQSMKVLLSVRRPVLAFHSALRGLRHLFW